MKEKMEKQSRNKKRPTDFASSTSPAIRFAKSEEKTYIMNKYMIIICICGIAIDTMSYFQKS